MSAEMSTLRTGSILPLAVTTDTRSRRATCSVRTSTPLSPPPRSVSAPSTPTPTTTPAAISTFFFVDITVSSSFSGGGPR